MAKITKVLVCEGDRESLKVIQDCVTAMGDIVIHACGAAKAWQILQEVPDIALIFLDTKFSEADGKEFLYRVTHDERFTEIPVIVVSGATPLREISAFLDIGASRFLPKPVNADECKYYISRFAHEV